MRIYRVPIAVLMGVSWFIALVGPHGLAPVFFAIALVLFVAAVVLTWVSVVIQLRDRKRRSTRTG
jgi:hypothetical protein